MSNHQNKQAYTDTENRLQCLIDLQKESGQPEYWERYQRLLFELIEQASCLGNYGLKHFGFHMLDNVASAKRRSLLDKPSLSVLFAQWPEMLLRYLRDEEDKSYLVVEVLEFLQDETWCYPLEVEDADWLLNIVLNPYDRETLKQSLCYRNQVTEQEDDLIDNASETGFFDYDDTESHIQAQHLDEEDVFAQEVEVKQPVESEMTAFFDSTQISDDIVKSMDEDQDGFVDEAESSTVQKKVSASDPVSQHIQRQLDDDLCATHILVRSDPGESYQLNDVSHEITEHIEMSTQEMRRDEWEQYQKSIQEQRVRVDDHSAKESDENVIDDSLSALMGSQSKDDNCDVDVNDLINSDASYDEEQIDEHDHSLSDLLDTKAQHETSVTDEDVLDLDQDDDAEENNSLDMLFDSQFLAVDEVAIEEPDEVDAESRALDSPDYDAGSEPSVVSVQSLEEDSANELLALITAEVQQLAMQVERWVRDQNNLESLVSKEEIEEYGEELNRIGAACEMIGMQAMHSVCAHVEENLQCWLKDYPGCLQIMGQTLQQVLRMMEQYLGSKHKNHEYHDLMQHISSELWVSAKSEDELQQIQSDFINFSIEIEQPQIVSTPRHAEPEDLSIEVPQDVNAVVLDGMLQELPGQVEALSSAVIALRNDEFMQQLEVAKRTAHTLKGAANTVGIRGIANLMHSMEDILEELFRASQRPGEAMHRVLIDVVDLLEQMTECLLGFGEEIDNPLDRYQSLLDWAYDIDQHGLSVNDENVAEDSSVELSRVEKPAETERAAVKTKVLPEKAQSTDAMIDELLDFSGEQIILTTQMQDKVSASNVLLRSLKKGNQKIQELTDEFEHLVEIKNIAARSNHSFADTTFDPLEVDQFNELRTFGRRLMEACADNAEITHALVHRVQEINSDCAQNLQLHKYSQKRLIQSSMVPVASLLPRLKRALRQATNATGKSVELQYVGEDTLVDKRMLAVLAESLLHLIRNAVDHGIESSDQRAASGKAQTGMITLEFIAAEDQVLIRCQDDGAGLCVEDIARKARQLGLLAERETLTEQQAAALVLQHGFSTRDRVTQLSGRGVGLDTVHNRLLEVNGSMRVTSLEGEGMQVELRLPANLLYAQVLMVQANSELFAISTRGLEEILPASAGIAHKKQNGWEFDTGENAQPLYSLGQLVEVSSNPSITAQSMLITLRGVDGETSLINVDSILRSTEAVIKPLSRYLPRVQGIIGSTVMGDGRLIPVLDLQGLMLRFQEAGQRAVQPVREIPPVVPSKRILIAEDSVSTRRALEEICRDLGYDTRSAIDGVDATALLQEFSPDLVITDLEMPRMNGFELVSHIRSNPSVSFIPVIMLTSRSTEKHKNEANRVGVDEYLTKPFAEDYLQEVIERLIAENMRTAQPCSAQ